MDKKTEQLDDLQRAKLALQLSDIGLCEYGLPPHAHLLVDPAWAAILGYKVKDIPRAEIFHSWWGQQIHPNDHARVINEFNQLYSGSEDRVMSSFRIRHKNNNWVSVEVSGTAMSRDDRGWARQVFTVMRDASEGESRYRQIVENLHEGIWIVDKYNSTRFVNQRMADMLGYAIEDILGKSLFDFMDKENMAMCKAKLGSHRRGKSAVYEFDFVHRDGHRVYTTIAASPVYNARDAYDGTIAGVVDVGAQRDQELQLKMLSSAVEQSGTMVMITNQDGDIEYVNPKFCDVTEYAREEVIGSNVSMLRSEETDSEQVTDIWGTVSFGDDWQGEILTRKKSGEAFWSLMTISAIKNEKGPVSHFVMVCEDVSQLKEAHRKMEQLAYVDTLTGLANRLLFRDRLEQVLKSIQRNETQAALLYLDLDQFKRINDSLGHDMGDALLMQVAERLRQCVRHQDTVARMGGDEFVILLTDVGGTAGVSAVARKIMQAIAMPFTMLTHEMIVTPSIGITLAPDDSLNADILLKNADLAMYRAKSMGRNNYQFFTEEMNSRVLDRLLIENQLRHAIENGELELRYQPQKAIEGGELTGVEALVRWRHPERGLLSPAHFIDVAEETGLVVPLGEWVLKNACREWRAAEISGVPQLKLSVNLSARQFRDPELVDMIQNILDLTGFKPINLELEITETTLMEYLEHAIQVLDRLKALGISISIDDFGTGYSSLNYLKRLPIDALKIDQTFIREIPQDKDDMEISAAVIAMAHKLGLKVIAEGVETQEQWEFLKRNLCDIGQGYLVGKPVTAKQFIKQYVRTAKA
jgi:diguanylate cyclase (GGDEF)-like protein/PAS domain S-box-containing protein